MTTLGRYKLISELGRGRKGIVFLAEDTVLQRKLAIKIPHGDSGTLSDLSSGFVREAHLAASLNHPHICQVYDVAVVDGQLVMAMEYVEGVSLSALTSPNNPIRQAVSLVKKLALVVDQAHKQGLIHRDLKPGNIMLTRPGGARSVEPKIMDFGIAQLLNENGEPDSQGSVRGTPSYMSPEVWNSNQETVGPAADVFSLGVVLYELLTGHLPYDIDAAEPPEAWFVKLVTEAPVPPCDRRPEIDPELNALVLRAMAKEVEDRFASMTEFAAALDRWLRENNLASGKSASSAQHSSLELNLPAVGKFRSSPKSARPRKSYRYQLMLGVIVGLVGLLASLLVWNLRGNGQSTGPPPRKASQPLVTNPATAPPAASAAKTQRPGGAFDNQTFDFSQLPANNPQAAAIEVGLRNADFANGLDSWELEDGGTGFAIFGDPGARLFHTYGPGRESTMGRMYQQFIVPDRATNLEFGVHGGGGAGLHIALLHQGRTLHQVTGRGNNNIFMVSWDITVLRGETVVFEVVDRRQGPWGFIGLNALKILPAE